MDRRIFFSSCSLARPWVASTGSPPPVLAVLGTRRRKSRIPVAGARSPWIAPSQEQDPRRRCSLSLDRAVARSWIAAAGRRSPRTLPSPGAGSPPPFLRMDAVTGTDPMLDDGFLTDILEHGVLNGDGGLAGIEDLSIPMTQATAEDDIEVQHVEVEEVQPSRCTKGSKRTKNFVYKEDEVICSGWLKVSKDPIHGANQTRASFWKKVHCFFEKNKKTPAVRSQSSIMHRWLAIQLSVNKYCACMEVIERRNQSGLTIQNKINEAGKMYSELDKENKSFVLMHCYDILKEEDKWKLRRIELAEMAKEEKKKHKTTKSSRPRDEEANNNEGVIEVDAAQAEPRKRSDGIKKSKQNMRLGGAAEVCIEAIEKMWAKKESLDKEKEMAKEERFKQTLELDKAALEVDKERASGDGTN